MPDIKPTNQTNSTFTNVTSGQSTGSFMVEEDKIEYLTNQNEFLKNANRKLVEKNKLLEEEFEKLLEENNNFRLVRNEGKIL